jgi:antitoxin (DNA-binding transcriptional repressor) of toxin-antitoxin stability system
MTERYSIEEAHARLAELVERAAAGEEIILGDADGARVVLRRYDTPKERRSLGLLKGRIAIAEGFDDPSPELMKQLGLEK